MGASKGYTVDIIQFILPIFKPICTRSEDLVEDSTRRNDPFSSPVNANGQHIVMIPRMSRLPYNEQGLRGDYIRSNTCALGVVCGIPIVFLLSSTDGMEEPPSVRSGVRQGQYIQEPLGRSSTEVLLLAKPPDAFCD